MEAGGVGVLLERLGELEDDGKRGGLNGVGEAMGDLLFGMLPLGTRRGRQSGFGGRV